MMQSVVHHYGYVCTANTIEEEHHGIDREAVTPYTIPREAAEEGIDS